MVDTRADSFPWAGQNIAIQMQFDDYPDTSTAIRSMLENWFNEYNVTEMVDINAYRHAADG